MAEYQENFSKLLSLTSSENRDSVISSNAEVNGGDEEFYEKIEAPKFVDFTVPDHYCPDDRYWFCLRVGCDQKHEEEMDSEAIYKNFVLRVMAARSPNVRLQKALDRNSSRTPTKCPLSAPPKSSKLRVSRMAMISPISRKLVDDKKRVVRPLVKPGSTPVTKTKPVAAKYLTTPRNKKCIPNQNSFRSVQNPKPADIEVPKSRMVAKALVFHSPKKTIKVKTSVELRTPVSKLCEGMNKLGIASQRKHALGNSSSRRPLSSRKVQRKPEESPGSQTCSNQEAKSQNSTKSKIKGKVSKNKLVANDYTASSKKGGSCDVKEQLAKKVREGVELQESAREEVCVSSLVQPLKHNSDFTSSDDSKWSEIGESKCSRSEATNIEENNGDNGNENGSKKFTSESFGELADDRNANSSAEEGRNGHEFVDSDDKENAATSDSNRMHSKNLKQNGRKILGMQENSGEVKKKVTQAQDKNLKGLVSSGAVTKLKTTNPKPFRLRTDERGILKEANLEKRTDHPAPQSENVNLSTLGGKPERKQGNNLQKVTKIIAGLKTPKGPERIKAADPSVTPKSDKHQQERKLMSSPLESNAIQRLEKFRKMNSPSKKKKSQGLVSSKNKEITTFLTPGRKLDVIHELSPEVSELRKIRKPTEDTAAAAAKFAASRSSSCGKRLVTIATEPNSHSRHVPRCIKKLK